MDPRFLELGGLVGLTLIVTVSKAFRPIRGAAPGLLGTLLGCGQCLGFWVGFIGSLALSALVSPMQLPGPWWVALVVALLWGGSVSLLSFFGHLGAYLMDAAFLRLRPP